MKPIGLTGRLFLIILATSLTIIVLMGWSLTYSLRTGFVEFVLQQDQARARSLSRFLASRYQFYGNWNFVQDPRVWQEIVGMQSSTPVRHEEATPEQRAGNGWFDLDRPDEINPARVGGTMSPASDAYDSLRWRLRQNWSLLDADGSLIAGRRLPQIGDRVFAIRASQQVVGWLVVPDRRSLVVTAEQGFLQQQGSHGLLIILLTILIALPAAWLLARHFLSPVRQLAAATHQLGEGDYQVRIAVDRQDELGQLAEDFNRLAAKLEQNEKMRRDFVADISHELRTPLAVLTGELEALEDGMRQFDEQAVTSLQSEVRLLSRLVDDLYQLALSDIGGLKFQMQSLDFAALIERVAGQFQERLSQRQLHLQLDLPAALILQGDGSRLQQLIINLMENSLRYTDPAGRIEVTLGRQGQNAILIWQDSAPGVSADEMPRLFERLYRTEGSRNRATGGAGLGLPLCEAIVLGHQGQIQAAASALGGLQITITLPIGLPSSEATH